MKIVLFGSDFFSIALFEKIFEDHFEIVGVVTSPDGLRGRNQKFEMAPVKKWLLDRKFQKPILQPEKASAPPFLTELASLGADLYVVVSYGQILKQALLDIPPLGVINVHPSLLPLFRGPSPVESAILSGVKETGVTIMQMALLMDAGDILARKAFPIEAEDDRETMYKKAASYGYVLLKDILDALLRDLTVPKWPQEHERATYTRKFTTSDFKLDLDRPYEEIERRVRAFKPKPGAYLEVEIGGDLKKWKILAVEKAAPQGSVPPGTILEFTKGRFAISCKDGAFCVVVLQPEGKKVMDALAFYNGFREKTFHIKKSNN